MGTVSVHNGSKGCESSDLWDTSPPNHSPIRPLWSGIGCLRSQSTLRTGLNEMYQSVRCTSGGTSSAVHTSTAARVLSTAPTPPTLPSWTCLAVHKAASPTRATLSHSLRTYASSSPGLWAKCLRWYTINAHDSSCIRNTDGNPVRNLFFSCKLKMVLLRDGEFSFLVWLQTTGATGSPPRK